MTATYPREDLEQDTKIAMAILVSVRRHFPAMRTQLRAAADYAAVSTMSTSDAADLARAADALADAADLTERLLINYSG